MTQHAASTMTAMLLYGVSAWIPEFLRRTYGMPFADAGFAWTGLKPNCRCVAANRAIEVRP